MSAGIPNWPSFLVSVPYVDQDLAGGRTPCSVTYLELLSQHAQRIQVFLQRHYRIAFSASRAITTLSPGEGRPWPGGTSFVAIRSSAYRRVTI